VSPRVLDASISAPCYNPTHHKQTDLHFHMHTLKHTHTHTSDTKNISHGVHPTHTYRLNLQIIVSVYVDVCVFVCVRVRVVRLDGPGWSTLHIANFAVLHFCPTQRWIVLKKLLYVHCKYNLSAIELCNTYTAAVHII